MKKYINSKGNPIAFNGREIKDGDILKVIVCGMGFMLAVYNDNGILAAKNDNIRAYVQTICKGSDKVEIANR